MLVFSLFSSRSLLLPFAPSDGTAYICGVRVCWRCEWWGFNYKQILDRKSVGLRDISVTFMTLAATFQDGEPK